MPSVRQSVLDYLASYLASQIAVANGYNFDVKTVARGLQYPAQIPDSAFPAVFISASDEQRKNITRNQFQATIHVALVCWVQSADGISGVQSQLDKIIADVGKAIEQDRTQNGIVLWTAIDRIRTDDGDQAPYGAAVIDVGFNYAQAGVTP